MYLNIIEIIMKMKILSGFTYNYKIKLYMVCIYSKVVCSTSTTLCFWRTNERYVNYNCIFTIVCVRLKCARKKMKSSIFYDYYKRFTIINHNVSSVARFVSSLYCFWLSLIIFLYISTSLSNSILDEKFFFENVILCLLMT